MNFTIVCQHKNHILFGGCCFFFLSFSTQKYRSDANTHFKIKLMFDARKRLMDIKNIKNFKSWEKENLVCSGKEKHQKDVFAFGWLDFMKLERNTVNCIIEAITTTKTKTHERRIKWRKKLSCNWIDDVYSTYGT